MSRLYGRLQGNKGPVTRCGHNRMTAEVNGWNSGIRVEAYRTEDGEDAFRVFVGSGSNNRFGATLALDMTEREIMHVLTGDRQPKPMRIADDVVDREWS